MNAGFGRNTIKTSCNLRTHKPPPTPLSLLLSNCLVLLSMVFSESCAFHFSFSFFLSCFSTFPSLQGDQRPLTVSFSSYMPEPRTNKQINHPALTQTQSLISQSLSEVYAVLILRLLWLFFVGWQQDLLKLFYYNFFLGWVCLDYNTTFWASPLAYLHFSLSKSFTLSQGDKSFPFCFSCFEMGGWGSCWWATEAKSKKLTSAF